MALAVEFIFTWYWIADFCERHHIPFLFGRALYMKAIHDSKKKDRIDPKQIETLLRPGMISMACVYPTEMRATKDLLRTRMFFKRKRSELLTHIENSRQPYLLPPIIYHAKSKICESQGFRNYCFIQMR